MEKTYYIIQVWDKEGNLMKETEYKTLKEAKEAFKEKCKRFWMEIELCQAWEYEPGMGRDTKTIEKQEIEVNI